MYKETEMYEAMLLAYELGKQQGCEQAELEQEHVEAWLDLKDMYLEKEDVHYPTETE